MIIVPIFACVSIDCPNNSNSNSNEFFPILFFLTHIRDILKRRIEYNEINRKNACINHSEWAKEREKTLQNSIELSLLLWCGSILNRSYGSFYSVSSYLFIQCLICYLASIDTEKLSGKKDKCERQTHTRKRENERGWQQQQNIWKNVHKTQNKKVEVYTRNDNFFSSNKLLHT